MKITTIDGKELDTDTFPDSKALLVEKISKVAQESKGLTRGHIYFAKNLDGTAFASFCVKEEEEKLFFDALSCYLFETSRGEMGLFKRRDDGSFGLIIPEKYIQPPIS